MKSLRVPLLALLLTAAVPPAFAATLTLTGNIPFSSLDGSADDSDPTPGVFAYNGDLVIDGTINCNDDAPLPASASACPISIRTTGNLTIDAGGAILAENRQSTGNGGNVTLAVGGDLTLHGPGSGLAGAVVSSSRPSTAGPHGSDHAGDVVLTVGGATVLEAGSTIAANSLNSAAGNVTLTGEGRITLGGLIASGPTSVLDPGRWSAVVLTGGGSAQGGSAITVTSHSTTAPGVQVNADGIVASEGQVGASPVRIEACGIEVDGLVASVGNMNAAASVVLRSGGDLLVAGQDVRNSPAAGSTRLGRVRADSARGGSGYHVYLLARGDIQVLGPGAEPDSTKRQIFAVTSDPSPSIQASEVGGTIDAVSLAGGLTASGNAFEAGILHNGNAGGTIDLRAQGTVLLDDGILKAVGDYTTANAARHGGTISVRSYQQGLSWDFGTGDVRPVGTGAPASTQGILSLTSCTTLTYTGTQFPTVGSPIPPFPATASTCADQAPVLPAGEPDLPSCVTTAAPVANDDAYTTGQGVALTVPAPGVLGNDTGSGLSATPKNAAPTAQGGMVTLHADGSFTYTPPAGFSSPPDDSFTYTATNGGGSSTATVRITVTPDTPPAVQSTTPANGATDVLPTSTVTITFTKPVTVTSSAFSLQCPSGTPIAFTVSPASPATTFTLQPSASLPDGASCTVTVTASQVTDAANVHPTADYSFSFTVDTAPKVVSTVPANGASNVSPASNVTVSFNKPVTVTGSAFALQCPSGTPVAFTVSPASPASSFTLQPTSGLPAGTTCTVSVFASGVTDAAGVHPAADYAASFGTAILAHDDLYPETVTGNVPVDSNAIGYSVTANDTTGSSPITITAFDGASLHGGTVSMTTSGPGIGRFTYNPPAGFQGADSFHYTISNGSSSSTATVNLNVAGMIWFIDNHATAGDGRLTSPFNSLAAFQAVNDGNGTHPAPSQNIFLYQSATDYAGPVTLLAGQKLIGQDATASLSAITGITPGASSAGLPAMQSGDATIVRIASGGNTVTLGSNNTVRGLTLGNSTGIALTGASFGTLTVRDLTIATTGSALSLSTGALDAILTKVSAASGTHGIALTSTTGSLEVTGDGASDPNDTTRGRTTAKNGGGTLNLGSGGSISGASSAGVLLSNAANVTLRNMTIQGNGGSGIANGGDGITASGGTSGLTLDNDLITDHAGNFGLHGTTVSNVTLQHTEISANATTAGVETSHVWDVRFDDLTGTAAIANSLFYNSRENIVGLSEGAINPTATLSLTVANSEFRDTATSSPGNDGLSIDALGSANVSASISGSRFTHVFANGFQYTGNASSGGGTLTVASSTFDNLGTAINIAHQGLGKTVTFDLNGNSVNQTVGGRNTAINLFLGGSSSASTLFQGKVRNNTVGNNAVPESGSAFGKGIDLFASGAGTLTARVDSNTVRQVHQDTAFRAASVTHTGQINVTVTNNDLEAQTSGLGLDGIDLTAGGVASDTGTMCAHLFNNVAAIGDASAGGVGIFASTQAGNPTMLLEGYSGAANNTTQINTFLDTTATLVAPPAISFVGAGTIKAAPSPCPTVP